MNPVHPEPLGDLHEQELIVDVDDLRRRRLTQVERHAVNPRLGFATADKAGDDEEIDKLGQAKLANTVGGKFTSVVGDDYYFEPIASFEGMQEFQHFGMGL